MNRMHSCTILLCRHAQTSMHGTGTLWFAQFGKRDQNALLCLPTNWPSRLAMQARKFNIAEQTFAIWPTENRSMNCKVKRLGIDKERCYMSGKLEVRYSIKCGQGREQEITYHLLHTDRNVLNSSVLFSCTLVQCCYWRSAVSSIFSVGLTVGNIFNFRPE